MGLFGYGEKEYKRNAGEMKNRLEKLNALIFNAQRRGSLERSSENNVGLLVNTVINDLELFEFDKNGNKKDYESIDARINAIIDKCYSDVNTNSIDALMFHLVALDNVLFGERQTGKEKPKDIIAAEERLWALKTQELQKRNERDRFTAEMQKVKSKFFELHAQDKNNPKLMDLQREYDTLEKQQKARIRDLDVIANAIANDRAIQDAIASDAVTATVATNIVSSRDANKILSAISQRRQKLVTDISDTTNTIQGFDEEMGSTGFAPSSTSLSDEANAVEQANELKNVAGSIDKTSTGGLFVEAENSDTLNRN